MIKLKGRFLIYIYSLEKNIEKQQQINTLAGGKTKIEPENITHICKIQIHFDPS